MKLSPTLVATLALAALASAGCKKDDPPPNSPNSFQQQPYGQQQPYQQQPYQQQPVQQPPAQTTAQPSPLAPPCQQPEGTCGFARCNMAAGRCAFPCGSNADCIAGSSCIGAGTPVAVCGPGGMPGAQ